MNKNLNEEILRIKEVMGIISEGNISLPLTVRGSFKGDNGDRTHAFQSTGGVTVGGMLTAVNKKLLEVYNAGYNPDITNIEVTINKTTRTTSWKVTIDKSKDGKAYIGLVTAGSCCTKDFESRADRQVSKMKTWNAPPENHKLVTVLRTTNDGKSQNNITIIGGSYKLKQYFYKYWKSSKKPHKTDKQTTQNANKPAQTIKPYNIKPYVNSALVASTTKVNNIYTKNKL